MNSISPKLWLALLLLSMGILIGSISIRSVKGPGFALGNHDPEYPYLMNGQVVRHWQSPQHKDHPGTTVQSWGAITGWLTHPFQGNASVDESVFRDPEKALDTFSRSLAIICLLIQSLAAVMIYSVWRSSSLALIFFLTPYISTTTWEYVFRVTPDFMVLAFSQLLVASLLWAPVAIAPIVLGASSAAILATKITGVPLLLLPLVFVLRTRKDFFRFGLSALISGLILAAPFFIEWKRSIFYLLVRVPQMIIFRGNSGRPLPPFALAESSLWLMVSSVLPLLAVSLGAYLVWSLKRSPENFSLRSSVPYSLRRLAAAGLVGFLIQILICATDGMPRYVLPGFAFCSLILVLFGLRLSISRRLVALGLTLLLSFGSFFYVLEREKRAEWPNQVKQSQAQIAETVAMNQCVLVYDYPAEASSESTFFGLDWGNNFTGRYFAPTLDRLYPEVYFYQFSSQNFLRFGGRVAEDFEQFRGDRSVCVLTDIERKESGQPILKTITGARVYLLAL